MQIHLLALTLLALCTPTWSAEISNPISYRMAKYSIARLARPDSGENKPDNFEWEYPVIVGSKPGQFQRINAWLRRKSAEPFLRCLSPGEDLLLKFSDKKLVSFLYTSSDFSECEFEQSIITTREAFGQYITFQHTTEWEGQTRPQHSAELFVFDVKSDKTIELETLFKQDALEVFNDALAEEIKRTKPDCSGRTFTWSQVSLRPPSTVFIEFPYTPSGWRDCGDGVEMLSGRVVSEQLLRPGSLRPLRALKEVR